MRITTITLLLFMQISCGHAIQINRPMIKNDQYPIILKTEIPETGKDPETGEVYTSEIPGKINTTTIEKLNKPLRALTAFYSAMGGTMCDGEYCDLTTDLGLGKQGSVMHKNLIKAYFPNDKVAELVLKQNCYLRPSGASTFSDYEYMTITDKGDTVVVDYKLMYYNHGKIEWIEGPDLYYYQDHKFKKLKRNLWTFVDNRKSTD